MSISRVFVSGLAFFGLVACGFNAGHSGSDLEYAEPISDSRLISVSGTRNFRDLGGYKTTDGHVVKKGLIFRSDKLANLGDVGLADISGLGVNVITDLRSDEEREQEPDALPENVTYNILPINDEPVDIRKLSRKIIMGRVKESEVMTLLDHRRFITNPSHRETWGEWLASLTEEENTPHLFHCTSGKDRTGYGAAIILLTLGVDKQTVMEDFLFSNQVLQSYNDATIASIEKRIGKRESLKTIRKIMGVSQETMEATFSQMETDYGSIDNFIKDGLGIDDVTRQKLKDKFLEPIGPKEEMGE